MNYNQRYMEMKICLFSQGFGTISVCRFVYIDPWTLKFIYLILKDEFNNSPKTNKEKKWKLD